MPASGKLTRHYRIARPNSQVSLADIHSFSPPLLCAGLVFAYAVPLADVTFGNAEQIPQLAAERLFGSRISNAFSVGVGLTFLATVSAFIVTGPRVTG